MSVIIFQKPYHSNVHLFHSLNLHLNDSVSGNTVFPLLSAARRLMKRLTYHFILLSIFYRRTKQTSNALLACTPCVFILNKTKTAKNYEKIHLPTG